MNGKKILFINDNTEFLRLASLVFREVGAHVITASDGMDGIGKALTFRPDLIILGAMRVGKDGLQAYKKIRQFSNTPLILLSVLDQEQLMLQGWESRVDDHLTKSINPEILLLHARTVLQRNQQNPGYRVAFNYDDGHLKIDTLKHCVLIKNKRTRITPVEFRLLVYFVSNAGKVLSVEDILTNVWGSEQDGKKSCVRVHISHLRSKIEEDAKNLHYIETIRGVGYIFEKHTAISSLKSIFEGSSTR